MLAFFTPCPIPSTRSVYRPGLVARLTPASAYQQWHVLLARKDKSCPRKFPVSAETCFGAVTRNNTGEPFTSFIGSHCALHFCALTCAAAERPYRIVTSKMV